MMTRIGNCNMELLCGFSLCVEPHLPNTMPPPDPQQLTKEVANACEHFCCLFHFFSWLSSFFHHRQAAYIFVYRPMGICLYDCQYLCSVSPSVCACICVARFGSIFQELLILNNSRGSLNSS